MDRKKKNLTRVLEACRESIGTDSQAGIAKALNGAGYSVGYNTVKGWWRANARNVPTKWCLALAKITGASFEWLESGEGPKWMTEPPAAPAPTPQAPAPAPNGGRLHAMQEELTRLYLTMEEPERIRLVAEFFGWAADRATGRGREGPPGQAPAKRKTSK